MSHPVVREHLTRYAGKDGQGEEEVFVADVAVVVGDGDAQGLLQDVLGAAAEGTAARPGLLVLAVARHRPDAVDFLDPGDDLRHVDTEPREGIGLGLREPGASAGVDESLAYGLLAFLGSEAEGGQGEGGPAALTVEECQEQMVGVDGAGP